MNILYMGYFCNEDLFNKIVECGGKTSHARQQLEKKILHGIIENLNNDSLELISYLPSFANLQDEKGEVYCGVDISYLWCNKKSVLSVFKAIYQNFSYIKRWMQYKDEKVIFMYSVNPLHAIPALLLRKIGKYKVVTLCSEVSIYRRKEKAGVISKASRLISNLFDNSFDGYVLVSKYMNEIVNKKQKPYIVMEGIGDICDDQTFLLRKREKAIMYAGGLHEDNGIRILIEGFKKYTNNEWELWIWGDGPLKEYVEEQGCVDERIKFGGILPNDMIKEKERYASFLINPRFSHEEFTKYSFPSKTLEYMSTGTPTIITKLKGIPEEYYEYTILLENESVEGVTELLTKVCNMEEEQRIALGKNAKKFVQKFKNSSIQGLKVLDFLKQ